MTLNITNAAAISLCDSLSDLISNVPGQAPSLVIYSGVVPVDCDSALSSNLTLVTIDLDDQAAFTGATDATGSALALAAGTPLSGVIALSGTATFFRIMDDAGTPVMQGSVGTSGEDLNLDTVSLIQNATLLISALSLSVPEQGA